MSNLKYNLYFEDYYWASEFPFRIGVYFLIKIFDAIINI